MLVPLCILVFLISTNKDSMQKIFPEAILNKLMISNTYITKTVRNSLLFFSLILFTIALSRPVMDAKEQDIKQEITPIIVAIDVSKSMLANDIYPTRLEFSKNKLLRIIEQSQHNALGVLLFAKSAFILSPITQDFTSLKYLVKNFDNGLNFDNGSNIYALIEAANKLFKDYKNKNLLILSDGANGDDFAKEIEFANSKNINIYTLATATTKPTPIKINDAFLTDSNNNIVTVALNENIKKLSLATNGGYINYTLNNNDIKAILNDIEIKSDKDALNNQKYKTYTELFYYPLSLAIFILLIAFSSLPSRKTALLLLLIMSLPKSSDAAILDFQTIDKAKKAYSKSEYKTSSKEFKKVSQSKEGHYNLANSLYKEKKYQKALDEYKKVLTDNKELEYKKLHNMGNAYVKTNKLEDAKKMYEEALKLNADQQTKENLDMVQKALKKKKQDKKDDKKDKDKNKDKKSQDKKKNKKDSKKESQDKENKKNKKDKKENENKEKNKTSKDKQSNKNEDKDKNSSKDKFNQQKSNQEIKQNEMSDLEERKWLNQINNQKTPILLRKVESKSQEGNISTPW